MFFDERNLKLQTVADIHKFKKNNVFNILDVNMIIKKLFSKFIMAQWNKTINLSLIAKYDIGRNVAEPGSLNLTKLYYDSCNVGKNLVSQKF